MHQRRFKQVDVFSETAYSGNPVAVVLDALGLDTQTMQHFARWTNLSETTFLLPPTDPALADYQLRIFTALTKNQLSQKVSICKVYCSADFFPIIRFIAFLFFCWRWVLQRKVTQNCDQMCL